MNAIRVGLLGVGAIGTAVGHRLLEGAVPGVELTAVSARTPKSCGSVPVVQPHELPEHCEVVVEAAGQQAVHDHVPALLRAGTTVLIVSTGALRDPELLDEVTAAGGDRLLLSSGAIGGIDLIRACRHAGAIRSITLTTTKPPAVLEQPWMTSEMVAALRAGDRVVQCFTGLADEAAEKFPASVNVAATLALAAESWDTVSVSVVGDPAATGNTHQIEIEADAGTYRIDVRNDALPSNPASSAIVVASVLRGLESLTAQPLNFV